MANKYYNSKENELNDDLIVKTIRQLADDYENGEIVEVRRELQKICAAIRTFEANDAMMNLPESEKINGVVDALFGE